MKITGNHILLAGIVLLLLLGSIVSADSEYCTPPPSGIITDIVHNGTWWNITITMPSCFVCVDNGAGYGDVECTPCILPVVSFTSNVTCGIIPFSVQFNDTSTYLLITSYYWDFSGGNTSTDTNPVMNYTSAGYYGIDHSITNATITAWHNTTTYINAKPLGDSCTPLTSGGGGGSSTGGQSEVMPLVYGLVGGAVIALLFIARR
jgi:PKD repeat protein